MAFQSQWLQIQRPQIQWVGTVVIGLCIACLVYILVAKRCEVMTITALPEENGFLRDDANGPAAACQARKLDLN